MPSLASTAGAHSLPPAPGPGAVPGPVGAATGLGASKSASTLLVLFIPSKDRSDQPIDQAYWVEEALKALGELFGGATAFPQGRGVWRDDAQGGKLLFDEPVVIQSYTSEEA